MFIPPRIAPLFPSTRNQPPVSDAVKIYKIAAQSTDTVPESSRLNNEKTKSVNTGRKKVVSKSYPKDDSDDE